MKKEKKIYLILSVTIILFLISLIIISIMINNNNKKIKNNDNLYLKIYQYEVENFHFDYNGNRNLLYEIKFDYNTNFDEIIYSIDSSIYNRVIIKDGMCYVLDATCKNKICMQNKISLNQELLNPISITCMPSGLYIILEEG